MNKQNLNKLKERASLRNKLIIYLLEQGMNVNEIIEITLDDLKEGKVKAINDLFKDKIMYKNVLKPYTEEHMLKSNYLFPSKDKAKHVDIGGLKNSFTRVCKEVGITLKDLDIVEFNTTVKRTLQAPEKPEDYTAWLARLMEIKNTAVE